MLYKLSPLSIHPVSRKWALPVVQYNSIVLNSATDSLHCSWAVLRIDTKSLIVIVWSSPENFDPVLHGKTCMLLANFFGFIKVGPGEKNNEGSTDWLIVWMFSSFWFKLYLMSVEFFFLASLLQRSFFSCNIDEWCSLLISKMIRMIALRLRFLHSFVLSLISLRRIHPISCCLVSWWLEFMSHSSSDVPGNGDLGDLCFSSVLIGGGKSCPIFRRLLKLLDLLLKLKVMIGWLGQYCEVEQ